MYALREFIAVSLQLYRSVIHAVSEMYKENGIRTFYKGELFPALWVVVHIHYISLTVYCVQCM